MRITVDKNVVELIPENNNETASMEILWRVIVDCMKENKKLVPIGEYIPAKENLARFVIEGIPGGKTVWTDSVSEADRPRVSASERHRSATFLEWASLCGSSDSTASMSEAMDCLTRGDCRPRIACFSRSPRFCSKRSATFGAILRACTWTTAS